MATAARIFGVLLATLGLAYGAVAVYGLFNIEHAATFLDLLRVPEQKEFGFQSIEEWKQGVRFNSWLFLGVGAAATLCGVGIVAQKEWARRTWVAASTVLVLFVVIVAFADGEVSKRYVELLAFALPSFALLMRSFRREERAI